jgi:hypothetical protein
MFGLMIRMRRDEPRCDIPGRHDGISRRTHRRANTKTGRDGPDRVEDLMGKQRRGSQDSIFVDNPFVDGFLEWMGSREGRQCIEVRDVLWDLLEDAELDAKQRQLIWPDAERLDLVQSIQRIQKLYPDFPGHEIEEVVLNWIDMGYDPKNYSQAQRRPFGASTIGMLRFAARSVTQR